MHAEQSEIVPDQVEHGCDRPALEQVEPLAFRRARISVAELAGELCADRLQIVARVEALGDLADVFAKRFAVAEVDRARERIDLRAGVIDIIFLGDAEARGLEQPREAVADHGAAAMAHVQRARSGWPRHIRR